MPERFKVGSFKTPQVITTILVQPPVRQVHRSATRGYLSDKRVPFLEQIMRWLESPVSRSSPTTREDLFLAGGPTLTEFFAAYTDAVERGKVELTPVAEFLDTDRASLLLLEDCGPVSFSVEVES